MRRLLTLHGQTRIPRSGALSKALNRWVERQADIFDTSKSHVLVTCVSIVSGISEEDYRRTAPRRAVRSAKVLRMERRA